VPLSEVTGQQIVRFLWQHIMYRFGIPHTIISDNGMNITSKQVASFYAKYKITHQFYTTYYPQRNGQVEISNRTILDSLDKTKGKWVEKLLGVLWAYRTNKRVPTRETPFSLAYGTETIIPVDISMPTFQVEGVDQDQNNAQLLLVLDRSEEKRQQAHIRITAYQRQIWAVYHKKVKVRKFQVRDLVLKRVIQTTRHKDQGKLGPKTRKAPISSSFEEVRGRTP